MPASELARSNSPPAARTRSFTEARPMWPSASASSAPPRRDPAAVVGDLELECDDRCGGARPRPRRVGVAGGVGEQFPGDREQQLVLELERVGIDVDRDLEPALARRLAGDRAERLLEAALLERHRVQRHHRLAQPRDRRLDDLVGALDLGAARGGLDQLLVGGEQGLQRVVVDQLGDPPPALILGLHHLGDELAAGRRAPRAAPPARSRRRSFSASSSSTLGSQAPQRRRGSASLAPPHSSSPRRIASATAAARSETPSFS